MLQSVQHGIRTGKAADAVHTGKERKTDQVGTFGLIVNTGNFYVLKAVVNKEWGPGFREIRFFNVPVGLKTMITDKAGNRPLIQAIILI